MKSKKYCRTWLFGLILVLSLSLIGFHSWGIVKAEEAIAPGLTVNCCQACDRDRLRDGSCDQECLRDGVGDKDRLRDGSCEQECICNRVEGTRRNGVRPGQEDCEFSRDDNREGRRMKPGEGICRFCGEGNDINRSEARGFQRGVGKQNKFQNNQTP